MIEEKVRVRLMEVFQPEFLDVLNESAAHAGHAGGGEETHFFVHIVSSLFAGKGRLERHRMVYEALSAFSGIHALRMKTLSPGEKT